MLVRLLSDVLMISITTSLVIIGLILLSPLFSKHYSAKWKYMVWLIIALRLLLPFKFSFGDRLVSFQLLDVPVAEPVLPGGTIQNIKQTGTSVIPHVAQQAAALVSKAFSIMDILAWPWLLGVVVFLSYHFMRYYFFRKLALRWSSPLVCERSLSKIEQIFNEMNVKKSSIRVLISEKVPNPMLVGFYKPILFLPHDKYTDEELEFIFKHELVHYKRKDIVYKLLLLIVQAIHWFNPFVWLMAREASREIEIYCDDTVVRKQNLAYRKRYCEAILSAMQNNASHHVALITNFSRDKHTMKQRFKSIFNMKKKRRGIVSFSAVLLIIVSLGILAACTTINGQNANHAGNSYSLDQEGNDSISYRNGTIPAKTPLQMDTTDTVLGRGKTETGIIIPKNETATIHVTAEGEASPVQITIGPDTWEKGDKFVLRINEGED